jgi:HAE1 family hydrophobic/amphiphilic exporter-1
MIQADPEATKDMESLKNIKVKNNAGEMAPISQFFTMKKVYGPDVINRFNMYTAMTVMVSPAAGYTSGEALTAIAEVAETLPPGFGYELGGLAREEAETSGSTTAIIFLLCFVFVYLLLAAQYESYILPLAVLLSVPFGLMGSFIFVNIMSAIGSFSILQMIMGSMSNDIYMQIALIMLMGLLAKNAILIVQFALERRETGMAISWSAVLGAAARLRPILMTSLAMVIGLLPMMFASGVGKNGNQTLGTAAVGGMLIGTICQLFVVPTLFVIFEKLQEKITPKHFVGLIKGKNDSELKQYTRPMDLKYLNKD